MRGFYIILLALLIFSQPIPALARPDGPALSGYAALMEAEAKGLIKKADQADIGQYLKARAKARGLSDNIINGYLDTDWLKQSLRKAYVVLSPDFVIPYGLADVRYDEVQFIVPAGLPLPRGPRGFARFFSYDQIALSEKEPLPETCQFPTPLKDLPPKTRVFALGTGNSAKGSRLDLQIDVRRPNSLLKKITVNSPAAPAVVLLESSEPTIWHFSWTRGTRIAAVYISGSYRQAVSGLPDEVPVLIDKETADKDRPCPAHYFSTGLESITWYNDLSVHLFGRGLDHFQVMETDETVVGAPLPKGRRLVSSAKLEVDKFAIPPPARPGLNEAGLSEALLREALAQGLIRPTADEDRRQYLLAAAKAEGLSEAMINRIIAQDASKVRRYFDAPYVVLSADFFSPDWFFNERMAGGFIAPEDLSVPPRKARRAFVYSYDEPIGAERKRKPLPETCRFPSPPSGLPADGKVFVLSGWMGTELDFQIEGSGSPARLSEVKINSPDEPAFLLLSTRYPTIWHFSRTPSTKIAAVYIDSRHKQIISGLPDDVPILINNQEEPANDCPPLEMSLDFDKLVADNDLARRLFNKSIDKVYFSGSDLEDGGVVGRPLTDHDRLDSGADFDVQQFRAPKTLFTGKAGLNEALTLGLIRPATADDIKAYKVAEAKAQGVPDSLIEYNLNQKEIFNRSGYVVLSPDFIIPPELGMVAFFVPEGMAEPLENYDRSSAYGLTPYQVYSYNQLKIQDRKQPIAETCQFPTRSSDWPSEGKVYAIGPKSHALGARLDFYIDDRGSNDARLMLITVNSPSGPVFLMLQTTDSTIWHFSWTPGTKIAAVYINGFGRQAVSGLSADVPVLIDKPSILPNEPSLCPGFRVSSYAGSLREANDLSRHLFNRDIHRMYALSNQENFVIGRPLRLNSQAISAEALNPQKFRESKMPRPGQDGLKDALAQGLIRKASPDEIHDYLNARAKAEGLPDHIIQNGFSTSGYAIRYNPYMVLSPDFVIPERLYESQSASFIVPEGLPEPKKSGRSNAKAPFLMPEVIYDPHHGYLESVASRIYSYEDLKTLPANLYNYEEGKYAGRGFKPAATCGFSKVPADFAAGAKVYALEADFGSKLDFSIEGSQEPARLMKVTVNSPAEPALLILAANAPNIWHFSWTPGTQIAGVFISGNGPQLVSGLPDNVPLLISGQDKAGPCPQIKVSSSLIDLIKVNNLSKWLFNQDLYSTGLAQTGEMTIGPPLIGDKRLESAREFDLDHFRDPATPRAGLEGLDEAAARGLIRPAGPEDMDKYFTARSQAEIKARSEIENLPAHLIVKMGYGRPKPLPMPRPYVILSPDFILPAGLDGDQATSFIVPAGLSEPKGPRGACRFFSYDTLEAEVREEIRKSEEGHDPRLPSASSWRPQFSSGCVLPRPVAVDKIYAVGASPRQKLDLQIDDTGHQAYLMRLTVNTPGESVALMLSADRPTIWDFSWTRGSKISAVIVSGGRYKQIISGLPEGVPVLYGQGDGYDLSLCQLKFGVSYHSRQLKIVNGLARHLFKKDVAEVEKLEDGLNDYVIGQPLTEESLVESAEELDIEKFKDPNKPLAGEAGLKAALAKGLIRRAHGTDVHQYLTARNKVGGLTAKAIDELRLRDEAAASGKYGCSRKFSRGSGPITDTRGIDHDAYVVLSPDFVIPAGLSFPNFYVPRGLPNPQGSPGCWEIFSYDDLRPETE